MEFGMPYGIVSFALFIPLYLILQTDSFEDFWKVASRITPSPLPPPPVGSPSSFHSPTNHSRPPSTDPATSTATSLPPQDRDTAYNVRSVPIRIYLPDLPQNPTAGSPRGNNAALPGSGGGGSGFSTSASGGGMMGMSPFHPHITGGSSLATYASTLPGSAGTGSVIQPLVPPLLDGANSNAGATSPGSPQLISSPLGTTGGQYSQGQSGSGSGQAATVRTLLETHLPLLFPADGTAGSLAHALVHGVVIPPETELAWLGACMGGADGWVSIVIGLGRGA